MSTILVTGSLGGVGTVAGYSVIGTSHLACLLNGAGYLSGDSFYNTSFVTVVDIDSARDATDFAQLARKNIGHTIYDVIVGVNKFGAMQRYTEFVRSGLSPQRLAARFDTIDTGNINYYG